MGAGASAAAANDLTTLPDQAEFMLEYLSSYEDRAGEPDAGKVVYNTPDGVLNYSSGGPDEATTFRLHAESEKGPGAFVLEYVSAYEDRVPGNKGKFVYNQDGGNFQWTSAREEATAFKAVGGASDFILEICWSHEDRAGEPDSGKVVYNAPDGNLNYSSGGPKEASRFKVINCSVPPSSLLPDKSEFMLEYLRSYEDRAGEPNAGKVVYNTPDGVLNYSSGGPDEATTFRLHEVRPGAFKLEYVSAYEDRVPGNEGKFVYNQEGGNFQWTSSADEATVFKAVGDASDFILEICWSYEDRAGEPDSGKVVYNSPDGNLNYSSGGPDEASHFKVKKKGE